MPIRSRPLRSIPRMMSDSHGNNSQLLLDLGWIMRSGMTDGGDWNLTCLDVPPVGNVTRNCSPPTQSIGYDLPLGFICATHSTCRGPFCSFLLSRLGEQIWSVLGYPPSTTWGPGTSYAKQLTYTV